MEGGSEEVTPNKGKNHTGKTNGQDGMLHKALWLAAISKAVPLRESYWEIRVKRELCTMVHEVGIIFYFTTFYFLEIIT